MDSSSEDYSETATTAASTTAPERMRMLIELEMLTLEELNGRQAGPLSARSSGSESTMSSLSEIMRHPQGYRTLDSVIKKLPKDQKRALEKFGVKDAFSHIRTRREAEHRAGLERCSEPGPSAASTTDPVVA